MQANDVPFIIWFWQHIGAIVPIFIFIIGGIFAMAHRFKIGVDEMIHEHRSAMSAEMKFIAVSIAEYATVQARHAKDIAVLDTHRTHVHQQLQGIITTTEETNRKIDALRDMIVKSFMKG